MNNLKGKYINNLDTENYIDECFEEGKNDNLNYSKIQKKLIYFINIIPYHNSIRSVPLAYFASEEIGVLRN